MKITKGEADFSVKEIEEIIARERKHIQRCRNKIDDLRADIKGTENAIKMWQMELKSKKEGDK